MFIVPVKFFHTAPITFECIDSIQRHHSDEKIVVVDSDSEEKYYLDNMRERDNVIVEDIANLNYATNAYGYAYNKYPDEEFYWCTQDSLLIERNLDFCREYDVTTVRYFDSPPTAMGWDKDGVDLSIWANEQLKKHVGISLPKVYQGVFGPIFFVRNKVMKELYESGVFDILPTTKYELCAMERIIGIVLQHLGYSVTQNVLQGPMDGFWDKYDETNVRKFYLLRQ